MKIQYMSDLHLEYEQNREYFKENPVEPVGDVLILAGDIVSEPNRKEASDFFQDIESKFKLVISTMGNHEFYFDSVAYAYPSYKKYFSDNHVILNNETYVIDNVKFIVSALWSEVNPLHQLEISQRLNDYKYIKKDRIEESQNITVEDTNYFHKLSRDFIEKELKEPFEGKIVVVTHHVPSENCIISKWRGSTLISAFASKLDQIILDSKIDCWIFGHQHEQFNENIGNTKMLSNPLGYSREENFKLFNPCSVVEV